MFNFNNLPPIYSVLGHYCYECMEWFPSENALEDHECSCSGDWDGDVIPADENGAPPHMDTSSPYVNPTMSIGYQISDPWPDGMADRVIGEITNMMADMLLIENFDLWLEKETHNAMEKWKAELQKPIDGPTWDDPAFWARNPRGGNARF